MTATFDSDADATRAIKAALCKAFPSARFSVTRGGACIEWTDDGPTVEQVKAALIAADCVEVKPDWRGEQYLHVPGRSYGNSIWFICYNVAKREQDKVDAARRAEEYAQQRQRETEAVRAAADAKHAVLKRPSEQSNLVETAPQAFTVFEELRQRAERDVSADDDIERQRRPSWAPPLIIDGALLAICIELELLKPDDKPIVRLWAQFADPKRRGTVLREQRSTLALPGIEGRGFELHAGTERGATSDILFEAQRDKDGTWRFGPRIRSYDYCSPRRSKWEEKIRAREQVQSGFIPMSPDQVRASLQRIDEEIAEIDAQDQKAAAAFYRRQQLRVRVVELARDRVLDFAGAPGAQMALASRLWGHCFNCGKELTTPVSLELGIGPECLRHKIANIWTNQDLGCDVATMAFNAGMPEDFVIATLAAPRPRYREPLKYFPTAEFEDGRVRVYRRDGPGVIDTFNSREEAWAWIQACLEPAPLELEATQ